MGFGGRITLFCTILILLGITLGESFKIKLVNNMEPYEDSEYIWTKRTYEDPRFYTASFGKRNAPSKINLIDTKDNKQKPGEKIQIEEKRIDDSDEAIDPRFYSSAFGKRSFFYDDFQDADPRLFSTGFGKRSYDMDDPRLYSAAFGK